MNYLSTTELQRLLGLSDLAKDPHHAMGLMVERIIQSLKNHPPLQRLSGSRVVHKKHNYDLLGYPSDAVTRESRYTKWVDDTHLLRTQTSSIIAEELHAWAKDPKEVTLVAPGIVYRRDVRDRWHTGEPHQMDIWTLYKKGGMYDTPDAIKRVAQEIISPLNTPWRARGATHPYTKNGIEIEALWREQWLEIGEGGEIAPDVLERAGADPDIWAGTAIGIGVERMVMAAKNLPDIRLLRDNMERVRVQMQNLEPWKDVSKQPATTQDMSLAVEDQTLEEITELVIGAAGEYASWIEDVSLISKTPAEDLPDIAKIRLGIGQKQINVLLRVTLRHLSESITQAKATEILRIIYKSLHQGTSWTYCP